MSRIAVIGNWHLAFVTAAGLAEIGHEIVLLNHDRENPWHDEPRFDGDEPGLNELLARMRGRIQYDNLHARVPDTAIVWLAIDTPLRDDGSPDVEPLLEALSHAQEMTSLLIVSSQVPVGFCATVESRTGLPVACVPENLRFGHALEGWRNPDRIVIGATSSATCIRVNRLLIDLPAVPIHCDLPTAEMVKHATNAFLATSISFANEIGRIGEALGADMSVVERALRRDQRIGEKAYVRSGAPFTGRTLRRDLRALQRTQMGTPLVDAVLAVNDAMTEKKP